MRKIIFCVLISLTLLGCASLPSLYIQKVKGKMFSPYNSKLNLYDYGDSVAYFYHDLLSPTLGLCGIDTNLNSTNRFVSIFGTRGYYITDRIKKGNCPDELFFKDKEKFSLVSDEDLKLYVEFDGLTYDVGNKGDLFLNWNQKTLGSELTYYSISSDCHKTIRYKKFFPRDTEFVRVKNKRKFTENNIKIDEYDIEINRVYPDKIILLNHLISDTLYRIEKKEFQKAMRKMAFYR